MVVLVAQVQPLGIAVARVHVVGCQIAEAPLDYVSGFGQVVGHLHVRLEAGVVDVVDREVLGKVGRRHGDGGHLVEELLLFGNAGHVDHIVGERFEVAYRHARLALRAVDAAGSGGEDDGGVKGVFARFGHGIGGLCDGRCREPEFGRRRGGGDQLGSQTRFDGLGALIGRVFLASRRQHAHRKGEGCDLKIA